MSLQVLQIASKHASLQADVIDPVLAASLKQDAGSSTSGMTARSRDLLAMLKQTAEDQWPTSLPPATASLLAQALLQEPGQPDVTYLFEARTSASQVNNWLSDSETTFRTVDLSSSVSVTVLQLATVCDRGIPSSQLPIYLLQFSEVMHYRELSQMHVKRQSNAVLQTQNEQYSPYPKLVTLIAGWGAGGTPGSVAGCMHCISAHWK